MFALVSRDGQPERQTPSGDEKKSNENEQMQLKQQKETKKAAETNKNKKRFEPSRVRPRGEKIKVVKGDDD